MIEYVFMRLMPKKKKIRKREKLFNSYHFKTNSFPYIIRNRK